MCDAETEMRHYNITSAMPLITSTECRVGSVKPHFSKVHAIILEVLQYSFMEDIVGISSEDCFLGGRNF